MRVELKTTILYSLGLFLIYFRQILMDLSKLNRTSLGGFRVNTQRLLLSRTTLAET